MAQAADNGVRLNRYLSSCGVGSRRGCEEFIRQGRVEINGQIVLDLATRVQEGDHVKFDGKLLRQQSPLTVVLNKPRGYLCTKSDPEGRKTIYELLPAKFKNLKYIGRLDYDSSGLLLLTSSGEMIEKITHPRFHIEKEYLVTIERPFDPAHSQKLLDGIHISEGLAKAESVTMETRRKLRLVLTQGYNRQIRRMLSKLDYKVKDLERIRIGNLTQPALSTGDHMVLNHRDIELACSNPK